MMQTWVFLLPVLVLAGAAWAQGGAEPAKAGSAPAPADVPRIPFEKVARGAKPGEVHLIPPGLYETKEFHFEPAGKDLDHPTVFRFAGEDNRQGRAVLTGPHGQLPTLYFARFIRLEGLWIGSPGKHEKGGIVAFGQEGIQLVGCIFFGRNYTLGAGSTSKHVLIRDCRLIHMGEGWLGHPIYFSGGPPPTSQDMFCVGNVFVDGDGFAIHGWHDPKRLTIVGNFTGGGMCGMVAQGHGHSAHHNVFWKPRGRDDPGNAKPDWDWCALIPTTTEGGNGDPKGPTEILRFDHNLCWSNHPIREDGKSAAEPVENYTRPGRGGTQMKLKPVTGDEIPAAVPWMPHTEVEIDAALEVVKEYFKTRSLEEMARDTSDKLEKAFAVLKVKYQPVKEDLGPFFGEAEETARQEKEKRVAQPKAGSSPASAPQKVEHRKQASPEALAAWDGKLKARVLEDLKAGRRPPFRLTTMNQQVEIAALDEKGDLKLSNQGLVVPYTWAALTLEERRNLAVGRARPDDRADQALALFFCLALGAEDQAQKIMDRMPDPQGIKEILDLFQAPAAPQEPATPAQQPKPPPREEKRGEETPAKNGKFTGLLSTLRLGHPRIYITPENLPALKNLPNIRTNADRMLKERPTEYAGGNLECRNQSGRRIRDFAQTMGLAYLLTGERKYADRGIQELKVGADFPEWGRNGGKTSDLYTSEMCQAFGIGYDWLCGAMSDEDRKAIREALVTKGLNITLNLYKKNTYWVVETENWNPTCNKGAAMGALAIAEEEPQLAESILGYSLKSIAHGLDGFGADGGYNQGPGYGIAAAESAVSYFAVLRSALGSVPEMDKHPGLGKTGLFPIYLTGPTGRVFSFYDSHDLPVGSLPWMFWMADTFKQPIYAHYAQQRQGDDLFTHLWRSPSLQPQNPLQAGLPLNKLFKDIDVVILRSAWEDPNALWVGFKGGDTTTGHSHLDMGSFAMDALGQRWAVDIGMGDYLWPNYWDVGGGKRWQYYRTNTLGHNTLVLDGQNQKYGPKVPVVAFHTDESGGSAIVNLMPVYPQTSSCLRGIKTLRSQYVLVQDELQAKAPVDVVWGMHTRAKVELNGNQATLTSGGKALHARILGPENAKFDVVNADAANNTPPPVSLHPPTPGVSKLMIRLPEKVQDLTLRVLLSPGNEAPEANLPKAEPLKAWKGWSSPDSPSRPLPQKGNGIRQ